MVVAHLIDVHISQLCINLNYNDFLLFSDELQLNIMIMLICYTLKLKALDSFQCRTHYIKFNLNPFKNQRARHDFPTLSSLLSNMQTRHTKIKVKITINQTTSCSCSTVSNIFYQWSLSLYLQIYKEHSYFKHNFL